MTNLEQFTIVWLQEKQRPGVVLTAIDDHLIVHLALDSGTPVYKVLEYNESVPITEAAEECWEAAGGRVDDLEADYFYVPESAIRLMQRGTCDGTGVILYPLLSSCPHGVGFDKDCQQCAALAGRVLVWWRPSLYKIKPIVI